MCLVACCWARIPRVVYAATCGSTEKLTKPSSERLVVEQAAGPGQRSAAVTGLRDWTEKLPFTVEPKY